MLWEGGKIMRKRLIFTVIKYMFWFYWFVCVMYYHKQGDTHNMVFYGISLIVCMLASFENKWERRDE